MSGGGSSGDVSATGGITSPAGGSGGDGGTVGSGGSAGGGGAMATGGAKSTGAAAASGGTTNATGGASSAGGTNLTGGTTGQVATEAGDASVAIPGPASFHCVNWADERDNFVNGLLQPSGLSSGTDTYATVEATAGAVLSGFQTVLGANGIRIPINEPTVSGSWWNAYKGIIDTAVAKNIRVIVAYWAWHNGKPDSTTAYDAMWQTVVTDYASNDLVFFDIHNEPYGFSTAAWIDFAAAWLALFPDLPKDRVIIAGSGYDQNVAAVAADSRIDGCLLSLHTYTMFNTSTTPAGWEAIVSSGVGSYSARTIATEWGNAMTTGATYSATGTGTNDQAYMAGVPNELRTLGMGSCYWPGLRIGDPWSITTMNGTGANITLTVTNTSGLDRIHSAWGM